MMTSKFAKCAVAVGAIGLAALLPSNAKAADAPTTATVNIVAAISIVKNADMSFGDVAPVTAASSVTLNTDGTRAPCTADCLSGGPGAAADFTVSGSPSQTYSITLPTVAVPLLGIGPSMDATAFISLPLTTGTLDGTGNQTLLVGATLAVGTAVAQTVGVYTSAAFNVTVNYN